jgi:hypothetical protein
LKVPRYQVNLTAPGPRSPGFYDSYPIESAASRGHERIRALALKQFTNKIALAFENLAGKTERQFRKIHGPRLIHRFVPADIGRHITHYKVDGCVPDHTLQREDCVVLREVTLKHLYR